MENKIMENGCTEANIREHGNDYSKILEDYARAAGLNVNAAGLNVNAAGASNVKTRKPDRADILDAAKSIVTGEREQQYGRPEDNFRIIGEMWETYIRARCVTGDGIDILPEDVAIMMALLKIARIASGNYKVDSYIDLAGYAACAGECAGRTKIK